MLWLGGEDDDQLWGSGRGAVAGCHCWVPLQGAIAGCHCSAREERVTTNFGGVDVVPLLGAIAGCHCRVPLQGAIAVPERKG